MRRRILSEGSPDSAGLSSAALAAVAARAQAAVEQGEVGALSLAVARRGVLALALSVGRTGGEADRRLQPDDLFLVASLTKPLVCLVALLMVERGELRLDDPLRDYLPECSGKGSRAITVRHLLTHTSGLPDMLPDNSTLRRQHAPLEEFVAGACRLDTEFAPGEGWQYQSMGILLLAELATRLSGRTMPELLARDLLRPLRLTNSMLGLRPDAAARTVAVAVPPESVSEWDWNSAYWRALGAPWGGLHATAGDLAVILQMLLNGGSYGEVDVLAPATVAAAVSDQLGALPALPEAIRRRQRWGFGWQLAGPQPGRAWPELASPQTFGHTGATGTIFWADPVSETLLVLLTNQPGRAADRLRGTLSTLVAAAWR